MRNLLSIFAVNHPSNVYEVVKSDHLEFHLTGADHHPQIDALLTPLARGRERGGGEGVREHVRLV